LNAHPKAMELWSAVRNTFAPLCLEVDGIRSRYALNLKWNAAGTTIQSVPPPTISLAIGTDRVAAALSHELLHFELALLGYPRLIQNSVGNENEQYMINAVLNVIDHAIMLPRFLELGFSQAEFLADDVCENEVMKLCIIAFSNVAEFATPKAYHTKLRGFLNLRHLGNDAWFASFEGNQWHEIDEQ